MSFWCILLVNKAGNPFGLELVKNLCHKTSEISKHFRMAEIQTLVDMGFPKEKAERALQVTNYKGVEPAMEWLLAHAYEDLPPPPADDATGQTPAEQPKSSTSNADADENAVGQSPPEAKSLRCDDCNKLFKDSAEVEFHAAKTGHSNFSESTEEKKPLTEEEKKAQLALIEEKLKQKRVEREERERSEAMEREKVRIQSGKDLTEAKKKMEELEMQKIIEQRRREKAEDNAARERVRAQIEADKAARKAKLAAEQGKPSQPIQAPATSTSTISTLPKAQQKEYTNTRIQIRLQDGKTLTETFSVKEQLSAVRVFIQMRQGTDLPFGLMTSFPRKVFTDDDYEKPLEVLGLVPSAVLIVTKGF